MNNPLKTRTWSPYAVGVGIGLLSITTFLTLDKALGASTTFVRAAGALEATVAPEHVRENAYFAKYLVGKSAFEWQFALVVAAAIGAFLAARLAGARPPKGTPVTWAASFGPSRAKRALGGFLGGALLLFGARMAGGCTSGHGISGGLQLAVSSWVFLPSMLVAGVVTAKLFLQPREA